MNGAVPLTDFLTPRVTGHATPSAKSEPTNEPTLSTGTRYWDEIVGGLLGANTKNLYAECLERMEREILIRVLRHTGGNQAQAALVLGITRGSLRNKIRTLGISITRSVNLQDTDGDK
jgi:DNA-binding protein Fis